jgi:heterodisulfide reductase subunit B2
MEDGMELAYYPGCTLKTSAANYEKTALAVLDRLDIQPIEIDDWVCCGASFSLSSDNLMQQLAPVRTLIKAKESGRKRLLTLCDMCFHTLKRSALFMMNDHDKRYKINDFLDDETVKYNGDEIEVVHLMTILDELGLDSLKSTIVKPLEGLKIAPYYGCLMLRPKDIAIDDSDSPSLMERICQTTGCESVYFPFKTDCCSSYQVVNRKEITVDRTRKIVTAAVNSGADVIVLSCPLCDFNLDAMQTEILKVDKTFKPLPVLYFTQLLALAMGLDITLNDFSLHSIDPIPVLEGKKLL